MTNKEIALVVFVTEQEAGLHEGLTFEQWYASKTETVEVQEEIKTLKTVAQELIESYKGNDILDKRNHQVAVEKLILKVQKFIGLDEKLTLVELSNLNHYGRQSPNYNGFIATANKKIKIDSVLAHTANKQFYRYTVREVK